MNIHYFSLKQYIFLMALLLALGGLAWGAIFGTFGEARSIGQWEPTDLGIGMASPPGDHDLSASLGLDYRYQYLSGGAGRLGNWTTWNEDALFPFFYIQDSAESEVIPVFTYYMICQATDACFSQESEAIKNNLANAEIMTAYWTELGLFFEQAAKFPDEPIILHVEPDMWGFIQNDGNERGLDQYDRPVIVRGTGIPELQPYGDTISGFSQALFGLRDAKGANHVLIAYHMSAWGVGDDFSFSNPSAAEMVRQGNVAADFYDSMDQEFDLVFSEIRDRDAGYYDSLGYEDPYWDQQDFENHITMLSTFHERTGVDMMIWQIPYGNTLYRTMDNTPFHYQDTAVQTILGENNYATMKAYRQAGVVAFLFGQGSGGGTTTCPCDDANDGVTSPAPINGNTLQPLSADDDGGYFKKVLADYLAYGKLSVGFRVNQDFSGNGIELSWNDVGADSYEVWRSESPVINYFDACANSSNCESVEGLAYSDVLPEGIERLYYLVVPVKNENKEEPSDLFVAIRLQPVLYIPLFTEE